MTRTRFSPPDHQRHDVENYRGLMFAAVLRPASVKLLLGCTNEEAMMFGDEARGRLGELKRRVAIAKAV